MPEFICTMSAYSAMRETPGHLTFPLGPANEPKFTLPLCPWLGGLPPLADGCGIGEGEFAGEVTRGLVELWTPSEVPD